MWIQWDDGATCIRTPVTQDGDTFIMSPEGFEGYTCKYKVVDKGRISATFITPDSTLTKQLVKERDDPTVWCL